MRAVGDKIHIIDVYKVLLRQKEICAYLLARFVVKSCKSAISNPVGFQVDFVRLDGKDAAKVRAKAFAAIQSEVPSLCIRTLIAQFTYVDRKVHA